MKNRLGLWRTLSFKVTSCGVIFAAALISLNLQTDQHLLGITNAHAGSAVVGGRRMSCSAAKVVIDNSSPILAYAQAGRIVLNRKKLRRYPSVTQRIIFLHECAHQYVGYDETEADCWAVRMGKRRGWLSKRAVNTVCHSFYGDPGSWAHLPGPARCDAMKLCFDNAKGRSKRARKKKKN